MTLDFSVAPLRRYLWDHLSEIIPTTSGTPRDCRSPRRPAGISSAWATGVGYEGFDSFGVELKKFSGGQSNPTFLLLVHLAPPHHSRDGGSSMTEHRFVLRKKPASVKVPDLARLFFV